MLRGVGAGAGTGAAGTGAAGTGGGGTGIEITLPGSDSPVRSSGTVGGGTGVEVTAGGVAGSGGPRTSFRARGGFLAGSGVATGGSVGGTMGGGSDTPSLGGAGVSAAGCAAGTNTLAGLISGVTAGGVSKRAEADRAPSAAWPGCPY